MTYEVYGNVLTARDTDIAEITFANLIKELKMPVIRPRHRISVLNIDESIDYVIPEKDISEDGGISFTENYQQGQRKNITLKLINIEGKYTPSINRIWVDKRFRYDIGIELRTGEVVWFPKGIFVMGNVTVSSGNSNKEVSIQLKDKFSIFESNSGTLETAYEITPGAAIEDVINGILNFDTGNGYILDYKPIMIDSSFKGFKTQATIRKEEGENLGSILLELATQMSAECYYNNVGNLCFYPINETTNDEYKPIIWTFDKMGRELHNLSLDYKTDEIVNMVKVVGSNVDNGIYSAIVYNENPASPICVQRIGRRMGQKYTETNVWNDSIAKELANYYLRKSSFLSVQFSMPVSFNPILNVNNICEVENDFLGLKRDKLLITSISFSSGDSEMEVTCSNTQDLPFML